MPLKVMVSSLRKMGGKTYLFIIQKYKAVAGMRPSMTVKRLSMKLARARKVHAQIKLCPSKCGAHSKGMQTDLAPATRAQGR